MRRPGHALGSAGPDSACQTAAVLPRSQGPCFSYRVRRGVRKPGELPAEAAAWLRSRLQEILGGHALVSLQGSQQCLQWVVKLWRNVAESPCCLHCIAAAVWSGFSSMPQSLPAFQCKQAAACQQLGALPPNPGRDRLRWALAPASAVHDEAWEE